MKFSMKQNVVNSIKLVIFDVDGVLTDSRIIISNDGNEFKNFNVKDGLGIVLLQKLGIKVAIITGKESKIVQQRLQSLGLDPHDIYQGQKNKIKAYESLKNKYSLNDQNIAYMGDDLPDLVLMNKVGLSATPTDSISVVKEYANYVCQNNGGNAAVREFCDYIIKQSGFYDKVIKDFIDTGEVK
nr:HAD-IIIA family hydrolase [Francisella marina]